MTQLLPNANLREPALPRHPGGEFLTFMLDKVEYGMDILNVQEIRGYELPTRIANAPSHIKGVMNLRGVIVPIMDLRLLLDMPTVPYDAITVTMVLALEDRVIGLVVDSVTDVVDLQPDEIKPAPHFGKSMDTAFLTGIGTLPGSTAERTLLLLDIDRFVAQSASADVDVVH